MKKQQGFTLIELVVVIIILGILAVTAAPKFVNLQSDARQSTLDGMKAALQGANTLFYAKALVQGKANQESADIDITGDGNPDALAVYGYINADAGEIESILTIDDSQWTIIAPTNVGTDISLADIIIYPADFTISKDLKCFVEYNEAKSAVISPEYKIISSGC